MPGFLSGAKTAGKVPQTPNRPAPSNNGRAAAGTRKTVGRYSALGAAAPRIPFLASGRYRCKVLKTYDFDGRSQDWFRAELEIVDAAEGSQQSAGMTVIYSQCVTKGDALAVGGPKVISFVMTALGYETYEAFDEAYPENSQAREDLMNRVAGVELDETEIGPNPLAGTFVMVQATGTGKFDDKTGTEYQEYIWVVDEGEG